eukprot:5267270-Amphidinium_carterae.1
MENCTPEADQRVDCASRSKNVAHPAPSGPDWPQICVCKRRTGGIVAQTWPACALVDQFTSEFRLPVK